MNHSDILWNQRDLMLLSYTVTKSENICFLRLKTQIYNYSMTKRNKNETNIKPIACHLLQGNKELFTIQIEY